MTLIPRGAKGVDFIGGPFPSGWPRIDQLVERDIVFVATYLKNHSAKYVSDLHDAGIAWLPIVEGKQQFMFDGGESGAAAAKKAVADCRKFHVPEGTTIIFAHDWNIMKREVIDFNLAAEPLVRSLGYGYGGYGGRGFFDDCAKAGVVFDLIWATNALSWLGGRHPDAHAWQGRYLVDGSDKAAQHDQYLDLSGRLDKETHLPVTTGVDKNVCQRPFEAWGPDSTIRPKKLTEDDEMPIITNKEQFFADPPLKTKFVIMDNGKLRHLTMEEWAARGSVAGTPWTNEQISNAGVFDPAR